jgi:hypothetical protein
MEHNGVVTTLLTDSMEQSPSCEGNIVLASQEIPHILWNPKVHYRVHMILPLVHIMNHINPVLAFPFHNFKISFNIILLIYVWVFKVYPFLRVSPSKPCMHFSSTHACRMLRPSQPPWFDHAIQDICKIAIKFGYLRFFAAVMMNISVFGV